VPTSVLILPVGLYHRRVWKSLIRSGAQKIFLLTGKGPYKDATTDFAKRIEADIRAYLMPKNPKTAVKIKEVDFSNPKEIYRTYARIIQSERKEDKDTRIIIDVSSTPMEGALASTLLGELYTADISYVPPKLKRTDEIVARRIKELTEEQEDEGEEPIVVEVGRWQGLEPDEVQALRKIYDNGGRAYGSMTEFIRSIAEDEKPKRDPADLAYKRAWIRVIHRLQEKGLVRILDTEGPAKPFRITEAGEGVLEGIRDYIDDVGRMFQEKTR